MNDAYYLGRLSARAELCPAKLWEISEDFRTVRVVVVPMARPGFWYVKQEDLPEWINDRLSDSSDSSGYGALKAILDEAFEQGSSGKGDQRHNVAKVPWSEQRTQKIADLIGNASGMVHQAIKKLTEGVHLDAEPRRRELLGVINYVALLIHWYDRQPEVSVGVDLGEGDDKTCVAMWSREEQYAAETMKRFTDRCQRGEAKQDLFDQVAQEFCVDPQKLRDMAKVVEERGALKLRGRKALEIIASWILSFPRDRGSEPSEHDVLVRMITRIS